jgi:hypothetical protein
MKQVLFSIGALLLGVILSATIYTMFVVSNLINQTNTNTANITSVVDFINKQLEAQAKTGQEQSIAK